jgi:uncharacterized protein YbdZ (MbtH family)
MTQQFKEPQHEMADVFISYARADYTLVESLVRFLETNGMRVWWDRTITAGERWDTEIETALDKARCVIVVWTKTSVNSRWVRTEAAEGLERGILIPLIAHGVIQPLPFKLIQAIDLDEWIRDGKQSPLNSVRSAIEKILQTDNETAPKPSVYRAAGGTVICEYCGTASGTKKTCLDYRGHIWKDLQGMCCQYCGIVAGTQAACSDFRGHRWKNLQGMCCQYCGIVVGTQAACLDFRGHSWKNLQSMCCQYCGIVAGIQSCCSDFRGHSWSDLRGMSCRYCGMAIGTKASCLDNRGHSWADLRGMFCEYCGIVSGEKAACSDFRGHHWRPLSLNKK